MSDKKLTVAELVARAAKDASGTTPPRRRRHRSLEEGGISVAELTGSLPAVKAKPDDARHTSEPIDDEDRRGKVSADELAARRTAGTTPPAAAPAAFPEQPGPGDDTPATPADTPLAAPQQPSKDSKDKENDTAAAPAAATPGADKTPAVQQDEKRPTPAPAAAVVPEASADTKAELARAAQLSYPDPKAATDKKPVAAPAAGKQAPAAGPAPAQAPEAPPMTAPAGPVTAPETQTPAEKTVPAPAAPTPSPAPEESTTKRVSVIAVVLMAVVALLLGVAVFKGFELLWQSMNHWVTLALGIAVTLGVVGCVHALRTEKDGLSMGLAGLAGLAVTFGPLAIVGW